MLTSSAFTGDAHRIERTEASGPEIIVKYPGSTVTVDTPNKGHLCNWVLCRVTALLNPVPNTILRYGHLHPRWSNTGSSAAMVSQAEHMAGEDSRPEYK